jgi:hypothetical protein
VIELNGELIAEYLDQRELYGIATMIKRRQDEEAQGPEPTTYLGLALSAPEVGGRFGVKPMVTGATEVPVALPASGPWAGDPVGDELPLGFSIEEVGALGGAGGSHEPAACEIAAPAQVSSAERSNAEQ